LYDKTMRLLLRVFGRTPCTTNSHVIISLFKQEVRK